ncbi:MAG: DUF975 family protein [Turicibacter sp.]|nr:DUF975 family protein [Turicibacter sp.]
MSFKEIKLGAKTALNGKRKSSVGAFAIYFAIALGVGAFGGLLISPFTFNVAYPSLLFSGIVKIPALISLFALIPLAVGLTWLHLDIYDKKAVRAGDIFDGYAPYWKVVGTTLLVMVYTYLWTLLLIVPGIIKAYSYSQTLRLLKDRPELSANEAITESRRLMDGKKWNYFLFHLSFIGWFVPSIVAYAAAIFLLIAGFIGSGIFFLVVFSLYGIYLYFHFYPYYYTADAGFYRELTKGYSDKDPAQ